MILKNVALCYQLRYSRTTPRPVPILILLSATGFDRPLPISTPRPAPSTRSISILNEINRRPRHGNSHWSCISTTKQEQYRIDLHQTVLLSAPRAQYCIDYMISLIASLIASLITSPYLLDVFISAISPHLFDISAKLIVAPRYRFQNPSLAHPNLVPIIKSTKVPHSALSTIHSNPVTVSDFDTTTILRVRRHQVSYSTKVIITLRCHFHTQQN